MPSPSRRSGPPLYRCSRSGRRGKTRVTCGSRVRRSLLCIFLIDADLPQAAGKKYYREYYRSWALNEPNPLIIGSPTRARTWDLRINRPSGHPPESRASQRFQPKRPAIFSADFARFPLGTINSLSRYCRVSLTKLPAPTGVGSCAEMRRERFGK